MVVLHNIVVVQYISDAGLLMYLTLTIDFGTMWTGIIFWWKMVTYG